MYCRTLTDVRLNDLPSLRRALKILHTEYHVHNVVISSIPLRPWLRDSLAPTIPLPRDAADADFDYLVSIVSSAQDGSSQAPSAVYARYIPCIPGYFSGVGDLFSALVLAHYEPPTSKSSSSSEFESGTAISWAVAQALVKTHGILSLTQEHASRLAERERLPTDDEMDEKEPDRVVRRMKGRELRLIQGQDIIRSDKYADVRMELWRGFWED